MSEAGLQHDALKKWGSHPRVRLWRANAGIARVSTADGGLRPIRMNVDGCPDAIGFTSVSVSRLVALGIPAVAIFTGLEFKSPRGVIRPVQLAFANVLIRAGGLHSFARSVSDVDLALGRYL